MNDKNYYNLFPIGKVTKQNDKNVISIYKNYSSGLKFLSLFSHAIIFYSKIRKPDVPFSHKIIKITNVDEKSGIILFYSNPCFSEGDFIYDIKPYFPCEDRVKDCSAPKEFTNLENEKAQHNITSEELSILSNKIQSIGSIKKLQGEFIIQLFDDNSLFEKFESYSHIKIFWWFNNFDKDKYRRITQCQPPYENAPKAGVFASRSPVRPNPIALTTAKIIDFNKSLRQIKVSTLDCFDNTPVIDISPYIPSNDRILDCRVPEWLSHWPEWLDDSTLDFSQSKVELKTPPIFNYIYKYSKSNNKTADFFKEDKNNIIKQSNKIIIKGARQNNLKNVDVIIPYNKITVITGVSGSGKSSLAFDTIFAESQRRFMDSLSTSQRSLYEQMEKPDFDKISGLPPAISISQKNIVRNPRSTVGTITDIYDCLRTLFSIIGVRHCPNCGNAILPLNTDEIIQTLLKLVPGTLIKIEPFKANAPCYKYLLPKKNTSNDLLSDYIKETLKIGKGAIYVTINNKDKILFQTTQMCYHCDHILFELTPSTFSFNNAESMCPVCNGLGIKMEVSPNLIICNSNLSILDGASNWWGTLRKFRDSPNANWMKGEILALAEDMSIDLEKPWIKLPEDFKHQALWGSNGRKVTFTYENRNGRTGRITRPVEGACNCIKRIVSSNNGEASKRIANEFMEQYTCNYCHGERLAKEGRMVDITGTRFPEAASMTISELKEWLEILSCKLSDFQLSTSSSILKELHKKLCNYIKIGVSYLNLNRSVTTLSGGELQRLKLIKQLESGISNILYVLDEPSTGLHIKDQEKLIEIIKELRDYGNTIIIVEHNSNLISMADYIIDVGPHAGTFGGQIVAQDTPLKIMENVNSETGKYLSGKKHVYIEKSHISDECSYVKLTGVNCNNLKNIDITFPTSSIICITGVSGSGKSSLVSKCLYPAIENRIHGKKDVSRYCHSLSGDEHFDKIIYANQNAIGRTPRSTPATYTGIMDEIRNIFASIKISKEKGYKANNFSFNSKEGQCDTCHGEGKICTPVSFMADIWSKCPVCGGKRYKKNILEVKYKDKSIYDVLEINVNEALDFFIDQPKLVHILNIMSEVGLGYLKLGQNAVTLSGGEAQRIKLAKELSTNSTGRTLYILDEPTAGLHFSDTQNLLILLEKIRNSGNTILIIEHNLDVIKNSDWIIDLGPEGGLKGGYVIAQGTPTQVSKVKESYTGNLLSHCKH